MLAIKGTATGFASLSLRDLLEARDLYHFHLTDMANVVGTAVGRYLMREEDLAAHRAKKRPGTPRTFDNAQVCDESWPCVLVLVNNWVPEQSFGTGSGQTHPRELVPNVLYLPDGRRVPVCIVLVSPAHTRIAQ